ncbi:hypothetical protein BJY04DRAFT_222820 [Aspergillus karnatakaensis]|uniref:uncharacterized protein n=1 Tax=Aspergillus karnatakaensis TaxID=1810916 RepID=UPI003CCD9EA1
MDIDMIIGTPKIQEFTPLNKPEVFKQEAEDDIEDESSLSSVKSEDMDEDTPTPSATPVKGTKTTVKKETPSSSIPRKRGPKTTTDSTPSKKPTPSKKSKKDTANSKGNVIEPIATTTPGGVGGGQEAGPATPSATPTKKATLPPIPTLLANAGTEDRLILRLRDEGRPWSEINSTFIATTGIKVGQSTLRMRYTAMKANFAGISGEDETRLLRLKKEIEDKFETEKWHRIVDAIVQDGGEKYPPAALQKKFRELSKAQLASVASSAAPASGSGPGSAGEA